MRAPHPTATAMWPSRLTQMTCPFGRRSIHSSGVARRLRTASMRPSRALPERRLSALGVGKVICASLLALALAGCGGSAPIVSLNPPAKRLRADDYVEQLQRWTRNQKIINLTRLDTPLRVHATFFSPEFVNAYVARHEELFKIPGRERDAMLNGYALAFKEHFTFVVFAATTDRKWNDLHKKDSIWRVALVNDMRQQVAPTDVKRQLTITETTRVLFPQVEPFYLMYTLRFPRLQEDGRPLVGASTRSLTLRFAGPLGKTELVWRLR